MAGQFHRLTLPAYYTGGGSFPPDPGVSYDYLNNGGAGTPANADGQKVGGPNVGTYLVAFGEDATSNNANRPAKALGENTDHLDDLLHRDLAVSVRTSTATGPSSSVVLPANTYLGPSGTTNNAAGLSTIFEVLDSDDNEIMDPVSGNKCQVTLATLSGGDAIGSGSFSANAVTLTISPAIPAAVNYRVYYGTRSNLATLPTDALTFIKIRGAQEVDADVQDSFRQLQGNNLAWDAPWTSTIWDLTNRGLDGVYRNSTTAPGSTPFAYLSAANLPGGGTGAWFSRVGPALTGVVATTAATYDPFGSLFMARVWPALVGPTPYYGRGNSGFVVSLPGRLLDSSGNSWEDIEEGVSSFLATQAVGQKNWDNLEVANAIAAGDEVFTHIPPQSAATLANVGAYNEHTGEAVITLTSATTWFRSSVATNRQSWLSLGLDHLEVVYTKGGVRYQETVVPVRFGETGDTTNLRKVRVLYPNGRVPDWSGTSAVSVTWHRTSFVVGNNALVRHGIEYAQDIAPLGDSVFSGMVFSAPPTMTVGPTTSASIAPTAAFYAGGMSNDPATAAALVWGGFNTTVGFNQVGGLLLGDGSIDATGYVTARAFKSPVRRITISAGGTQTLDCSTHSIFYMQLSAGVTYTVTLNVNNAQVGQEVTVVAQSSFGGGLLDITWGSDDLSTSNIFSGSDGEMAPGDTQVLWRGVVTALDGPGVNKRILWTTTRY